MPYSHAANVRRAIVFFCISERPALDGTRPGKRARVEVICPSRPVPFPLDKRTGLVYELHVTNFDVVPLTLKRIEISANALDGERLQSLAGDSLSAATVRAGSTGAEQSKPRRRIVW
jgi:hypothetical protein